MLSPSSQVRSSAAAHSASHAVSLILELMPYFFIAGTLTFIGLNLIQVKDHLYLR